MGIDTTIAILDGQLTTEMVQREAATYAGFVEQLERQDDAEPQLTRFRAKQRAIRKVGGVLEDLDEPPAVNELDFDALLYGLYGFPFVSPSHFLWLNLIRNSTVLTSKVPEFLAEESLETAGLWCKLVGTWSAAAEYAGLEPPFELHLDGATHLVDREQMVGGFVQGDELVRLAEGLRPRLSETAAFYDSLRDKYSNHAQNATPVELVFALSSLYGYPETDTAIFTLFD